MEVKLTGIMNTTALKPGEAARYGTEVAPRLHAPFHQHFFNARLDFAVDGENNTAYEVNTRGVPSGPENPHGNAFVAEATPLARSRRPSAPPIRSRPASGASSTRADSNGLGGPSAIGFARAKTSCRLLSPAPRFLQRAGFLTKNFWVTPYDPRERFPAGEYPNQNPGGDGLPKWTQADRDIDGTRPRRLVHVRPNARAAY